MTKHSDPGISHNRLATYTALYFLWYKFTKCVVTS